MRTCGQRTRIGVTTRAVSSNRPGGRVDVGAPQLGRQQMRAAEDVQRQIAVAVIVAMKEATFLMPVQRIVGGVEIEDDMLRWVLMRFHEQIRIGTAV